MGILHDDFPFHKFFLTGGLHFEASRGIFSIWLGEVMQFARRNRP